MQLLGGGGVGSCQGSHHRRRRGCCPTGTRGPNRDSLHRRLSHRFVSAPRTCPCLRLTGLSSKMRILCLARIPREPFPSSLGMKAPASSNPWARASPRSSQVTAWWHFSESCRRCLEDWRERRLMVPLTVRPSAASASSASPARRTFAARYVRRRAEG